MTLLLDVSNTFLSSLVTHMEKRMFFACLLHLLHYTTFPDGY